MLKVLRNVIVKEIETDILACPTCWDEDHPQLLLGKYPVDDPQAIRNPRSDQAGYAQSRAQIIVAPSFYAPVQLGIITVSTP